jgi:hypothetical protein
MKEKYHISRAMIIDHIDLIVDSRMTWKEAIEYFKLYDGNLQKVYIRYMVQKYGYMTTLFIVNDGSVVP